MEPQQLATKVAQLESRVATLEDEGKIVKGEVKQILTEIRTAILVRENPFEVEAAFGRGAAALVAGISQSAAPAAPAPEPAPHRHEPEPAQAPKPKPERIEDADDEPEPPAREPAKEPIMLRPQPTPVPPPASEEPQPNWSLLTIAGLSAWAEEAMRRVGPLRLEILLDLCEAAGHMTPQARQALARVTELDLPEPDGVPSTNETVVLLRQLDALVNDDDDCAPMQARRL
ncbi:MAG: hypothetical protein EPO22_06430 [Dehalococcoidia bacterium]|nr:MAG: hypothetical protein EPO22_06430 [Dehalococcoidia bacterium]